MKERAIDFRQYQVLGALAGTVTRFSKVLKPQPFIDRLGNLCAPGRRPGDVVCYGQNMSGEPFWRDYPMPYTVGDRLWVRETWQHYDWSEDGDPQIRHKADGALLWPSPPEDAYAALNERWAELSDPENYGIDNRAADRRWRPSIHMPKWAARIWLTVTEVRVQRLQDISEEDARAEGARPAFTRTTQPDWPVVSQPSYVWGFEELWDSIHGSGAFERNDWVAAITFERTS